MATLFLASYALVTELARDIKAELPLMESDEHYDSSWSLKRFHPELESVENLKGEIRRLETEFHQLSSNDLRLRLSRYDYIAAKLFESLPFEAVAASLTIKEG